MYNFHQLKEKDCGFTCLKMLLATIFSDNRYRYLDRLETESLSLASLVSIAAEYNVALQGFKFKSTALHKKIAPFILTYTIMSRTHSVFVYKRNKKKLYAIDPGTSNKIVIDEESESLNDAVILAISKVGLNCLEYRRVKTVNPILLSLFIAAELLSLVCLLAAFVEYKPEGNVLLSTAFIGSSILFSLLSKVATKLGLDDFDKKITYRNIAFVVERDKFYKLCNEYKVHVSVQNASFIINVIQILSLTVICSLWSVWFLLPVFVYITLSVGLRYVREKIEAKAIRRLETNERELVENASVEYLKKTASNISKDTSLVFLLRFVIDLIPLVTVAIFLVTFCVITGEFMMTNILFLIASIFLLKNRSEQVMNYILDKNRKLIETKLAVELQNISNKKTPS